MRSCEIRGHLGDQDNILPAAARAQPAADDLFRRMHLDADLALVVNTEVGSSILPRLPATVSFCGVKQRDAALSGVIHNRE